MITIEFADETAGAVGHYEAPYTLAWGTEGL